jgi:low molecular weight phosphotyrosine protein phosphatase
MSTLEKNGITDYTHAARKVGTASQEEHEGRESNDSQIQTSDFDTFDYIFAMDRQNLSDLNRLRRNKPNSKAKVMLFGEYSGRPGKPEEINDPYYGALNGFAIAYEQTTRFSKNFLEEVFPDVKHSE